MGKLSPANPKVEHNQYRWGTRTLGVHCWGYTQLSLDIVVFTFDQKNHGFDAQVEWQNEIEMSQCQLHVRNGTRQRHGVFTLKNVEV